MKPVILSVDQWQAIREQLHTEYPKTVFMIRSKMKQVLGFTVREHSMWINAERIEDFHNSQEGWHMGKKHVFQIHLDFYSENKRTMFLLKFSELIGNANGKL
jgi:hypothetical protein